MTFRSLIAAIALSCLLSTPAAAAPLYHLVKTIKLPGAVKWDYLHFDAPSHRLYISHGNEVTVVDTQTDQVVGALAGLPGSHGIAVDPVTGDVYADSAAKRQAVAFNPHTFKPLASMKVVRDADGMAYDPAQKRIFVVGGDGQALTPIDPATNKALADIALGGTPEFLVADGKGSLYVNINDKNEIARIDTKSGKIIARWPTAPCRAPTGLAMDRARRLLFSSCHSGVMAVMNADTGTLIAALPIGVGTDAAAYDPVRHRAFSSNADGTLSVISDAGAKPSLLGTVKTRFGARTLAVNPATGVLYTVTAKVVSETPPAKPDGRPRFTFVPGSLELLAYAPATGG